MQDNNPFKDVSIRHESSLGRMNHRVRNLRKSVRPDLGEYFETNIKQTYRPELINANGLCLLRKKSYRSKIQLKQMKLSSKKTHETLASSLP